MASHKHRSTLLDALNRKEMPIETLSWEVRLYLIISSTFPMKNFLLKGPLTLDLY